VLSAKAFVVTAVVLAAVVAAVAGCLLAGSLILPGFSVGGGPMLRAAVGSVLYLGLIGLLSLGTATVVRDSASAIGVVLGLLFLFPILIQVVSDPDWHKRLQKIAPMNAGLSIQATRDVAALPIGPWQGLGVLTLWAAGALVLGGLLLRLRDA
jgi:ABC-2 type transport system permease protein